MILHPYLFFTNTTRQAMTFYQEVLGGELEILGADEMSSGEDPPFAIPPDFVMHAALVFGDGTMIMASDDPTGDGGGMKGAALHLTFETDAELRRVFEAFADGGEITMPLEPTFWAPLFGAVTDRFGVAWMVSLPGADG
jgi:PhnB protein